MNPPFTVQLRAPQIDRWVVFCHVVAVVVCAMMSLADRGLLVNPDFSEVTYGYLIVLANPAAVVGLLCPCVLTMTWLCGFVPNKSAVMAGIAEFLLFLAQLYALLPAVS